MEIIPIWKDTYYSTTGTTPLEFYVLKNDEYEIFHGYAYPAPVTQLINIKLNDICSSHLSSKIPYAYLSATADTVAIQEGYAEFTLKILNSLTGLWDTAMQWAFVNDTSYEAHNGSGCYSEPINGHAANGMILPYSYVDTGTTTICYEIN